MSLGCDLPPYTAASSSYSPSSPDRWLEAGARLFTAGQYAQARSAYRLGLKHDPDNVEGLIGLGTSCLALGEPVEAVSHLEAAIRLAPNNVKAHVELGHGYHILGESELGWNEFAWTWRTRVRRHSIDHRLWDGTALNGRTILLWTEQGRGDTIQFLRYIPFVVGRGGDVLVECHHAGLIPLVSRVRGVRETIQAGQPLPAYDVHAPLVYFPALFPQGRVLSTSDVPYLTPDPRLIQQWRTRLRSDGRLAVGISWAGNERHPGADTRFVPPQTFVRLACLSNVRVIGLQYGVCRAELARIFPDGAVEQPFDDTFSIEQAAALIANLDLVISVDTMVAHLASALGKPVWLLLRHASNWRWQFTGDRTPWYPSMRLFRQRRRGDWDAVFVDVEQALRRVLLRR